jgi:hypothetical protein
VPEPVETRDELVRLDWARRALGTSEPTTSPSADGPTLAPCDPQPATRASATTAAARLLCLAFMWFSDLVDRAKVPGRIEALAGRPCGVS